MTAFLSLYRSGYSTHFAPERKWPHTVARSANDTSNANPKILRQGLKDFLDVATQVILSWFDSTKRVSDFIMQYEYYLWSYRLDQGVHTMIKLTATPEFEADGPDIVERIITDERGCIPIFVTKTQLSNYVQEHYSSGLADGPPVWDIEGAARWLKLKKMKRARQVDCVSLLNAWNLFDDVSRSIGGQFDPDQERTQKIYAKIFWGNNIPAVTPEGRCYVPQWSGEELRIIHEVLSHGFKMFRDAVRRVR